jgi:hypothetical protein
MAIFNEDFEKIADVFAIKHLPLEQLQATSEWQRFADAARKALQAFEALQANSEGPASGAVQP